MFLLRREKSPDAELGCWHRLCVEFFITSEALAAGEPEEQMLYPGPLKIVVLAKKESDCNENLIVPTKQIKQSSKEG